MGKGYFSADGTCNLTLKNNTFYINTTCVYRIITRVIIANLRE